MMSHGMQSAMGFFSLVFSANANDVDLRAVALARGWNGTQRIKASISPGVILQGVSAAALTVSGAYPLGVELLIDATAALSGKAGAGGAAGVSADMPAGGAGSAGGLALAVGTPVQITNNGTIAGGGGGGGGGAGAQVYDGSWWSVTGGAGGSGARIGLSATSGVVPDSGQPYSGYAGTGGNGGALGTAGSTGGSGLNGRTPGAGGAAGAAVAGNSNITWRATGTRTGSIS